MPHPTHETIPGTGVRPARPWPPGTALQGGPDGLTATPHATWTTAFVEVFANGTFLRGEGTDIHDAEADVWDKYVAMCSCPGHGPYEARGYTNGAGFCANCGTWFPNVLPATT